jgi:hypothetical protein
MDFSASMRFEHGLLAVEQEHTVSCMLELTAPAPPPTADRRPLALALVLDRSSSRPSSWSTAATRSPTAATA